MRYFIFLTVLLFSATASADIEAQFFTGDGGDAEYDGVDVRVGDDRGKGKGEKSDVDSAVSIALAFTYPSGNGFQIGPRIGWFYFEPETDDDPKMEISIIDAGLWGRKSVKMSDTLGGFLGFGGGVSYGKHEVDVDSLPELTGYGYHIIVGAGIETEAEGMKISAGLYYTQHTFDELEGQKDSVEVTMKDATVSQVMLGGGFRF